MLKSAIVRAIEGALESRSGGAPNSTLRDLYTGVTEGVFKIFNVRVHLTIKLSCTRSCTC